MENDKIELEEIEIDLTIETLEPVNKYKKRKK